MFLFRIRKVLLCISEEQYLRESTIFVAGKGQINFTSQHAVDIML